MSFVFLCFAFLCFVFLCFVFCLTFPPPPSSPPSPHERVQDVGLTATSTSGGKIVIDLGIEDVDEDDDGDDNGDDDVGEDEDEDKARACARCLVDSYIKI